MVLACACFAATSLGRSNTWLRKAWGQSHCRSWLQRKTYNSSAADVCSPAHSSVGGGGGGVGGLNAHNKDLTRPI